MKKLRIAYETMHIWAFLSNRTLLDASLMGVAGTILRNFGLAQSDTRGAIINSLRSAPVVSLISCFSLMLQLLLVI